MHLLSLLLNLQLLLVEPKLHPELLCVLMQLLLVHTCDFRPLIIVEIVLKLGKALLRPWCRVDKLVAAFNRLLVNTDDMLSPLELYSLINQKPPVVVPFEA